MSLCPTTVEMHGYYRLAMLAELNISINSSVTGQLFHYNTSFFNIVFCDLNTNCTLNLHSYWQLVNVMASAGSTSVCYLAFADEHTYSTVVYSHTIIVQLFIIILSV